MESVRPRPTLRKADDLQPLWAEIDEAEEFAARLPAVPTHPVHVPGATRPMRADVVSVRVTPADRPQARARESVAAYVPVGYPRIDAAPQAVTREFLNPLHALHQSAPAESADASLTIPLLGEMPPAVPPAASTSLSLQHDRDTFGTERGFLEERAMAHELEACTAAGEESDRSVYHQAVAKILRAEARSEKSMITRLFRDASRKESTFILEETVNTLWKEKPALRKLLGEANDAEALRLFKEHDGSNRIADRSMDFALQKNLRVMMIGAAAVGETAAVGATIAVVAPPLATAWVIGNSVAAQAVAARFYMRALDELVESLRPSHRLD